MKEVSACLQRGDDGLGNFHRNALLGLGRAGAQMRRAHHVLAPHQRVVGRRRLLLKDVQRCLWVQRITL